MANLIRPFGLTLLCAGSLIVSSCGGRSPQAEASFTPTTPTTPSRTVLNILPPGQSAHFSSSGQAAGSGSGNPADYGEHVDDQRALYWGFQFKPGEFMDISNATPVAEPIPGSKIYRDAFGVPVIYGSNRYNTWYGAGYALAQDRLFLLDGARRQATGTLAELTGPETIPADLAVRVTQYSDAEYTAMFNNLSAEAQEMATAYVDGSNAWIAEVNAALASNPTDEKVPNEYVVLTQSSIKPLTINEVMALGVFITRFVASEGGNEFDNVKALRELESENGHTKAVARQVFKDVMWLDDPLAAVTVPAGSTHTSNIAAPAGPARDSAFTAMADYADTLPLDLAVGDGTVDDSNVPVGCSMVKGTPNPTIDPKKALAKIDKAMTPVTKQRVTQALAKLNKPERHAKGASYLVTVAPSRTADGSTQLISGPQLGYSYPSLLAEFEVHGGGIDARGVTVPGLPVVGIGYGKRLAWALTTGNSKTIDSFIETLGTLPNTYMHNGMQKNMECRNETFNYRQAIGGVPFGPASCVVTHEICRTVHGPVVARSADNVHVRSVQYAMWGREVETIEGIIGWNKAQTFAEFNAAMALVTWNENTGYADADGNIAYYHPGLHHVRNTGTDQRFPIPGDGSFDHGPHIPFAQLPQSINPAQGWLTNWNNKPVTNWGEGAGGHAVSLPAGPYARVVNWIDELAADSDITLNELLAMDRRIGIRDPRAKGYVPVLQAHRSTAGFTAQEGALVDLILAWDQNHYNPAIDINDTNARDTAGATAFDYVVKALRNRMLTDDIPGDLTDMDDTSLLDVITAVGNHEYDAPGVDTLVIKNLDPSISGIPLVYDFLNGQTVDQVIKASVADAIVNMNADAADTSANTPDLQGPNYVANDPTTYERIHHRDEVCSLTGIVGPCIDMPHQDRGSWIHILKFDAP